MAIDAAELKTRFTADTTPAEKTLKEFVGKQAATVKSGFSGMGAAIGLSLAASVAGMAVRTATEYAKLATANKKVETSFEDLAETAGESSEEILRAMQDAAGGTISDYNLMLSANRAMMLGVADSAAEMTQLLQVARQRGQALGLSSQQAFNDIVTGLGRGSALILDNLGIIVELDEAYQSYALSVGKAADELTNAEKKQALVNDALKQAGTTDAPIIVDQFERMAVSADKVKMAMAEAFGPGVMNAAGWLADRLDEIANPNNDAPFTYGGPSVNDLKAIMPDNGTPVSNAMEEKIRAEERAYRDLAVAISAAAAAEEQMHKDSAAAWAERGESLKEEIAGITDAMMGDMSFEQIDAINTQLTGLIHTIEHANTISGGEDKALYGTEKQLLAIESVVKVLTDDMATVQEITAVMGGNIGNALEGLLQTKLAAAQLREETEAAADAQQLVYDGWNRMAGIVGDVQRQLVGVIGESAFDNFDEYESQLWDVFNAAIDGGRSTEEAFFLTEQAADELVSSVTALNGGTLDEVADAAFRAESQLWGTAAAAQAVLSLLDQSAGAVNGAFLGAVGSGLYSASEGQALAGQINSQREALIRDMAEFGVPLDDATFALAEFDAGTQELISTERQHQAELRRSTAATKRSGDAANKAADGLRDLEGALKKIPGLFDPSEVTQEQLDGAARGEPQNFADDYLRRLRDEVQNGNDWEGVDIKDAAAAMGMDPEAAAEQVLNAFEAAWADSSLFADPANMDKFLNMDAIQAALQNQQDASQGEKNLKALFGIGDAEDVNAIADLGLNIQSGLADWLSENGMDDAGARLAEALAGGLETDDLGEAAAKGIDDYITSQSGQDYLKSLGYDSAAAFAAGLRDGINSEMQSNAPPVAGGGSVPPLGGSSPPVNHPGGRVQAQSVGGVTFIQNNSVRTPHEAALTAQYTAQELARRSRR